MYTVYIPVYVPSLTHITVDIDWLLNKHTEEMNE